VITAQLTVGLLWAVSLVPLAFLCVFRVMRGPRPWTISDSLLSLCLMIWVGNGPSAVAMLGIPDDQMSAFHEAGLPPEWVVLVVAASMLGSASAALFCWFRAGPAALGLSQLSPRWVFISFGLALPLAGLWWLWELLLHGLEIEVEYQMISKAVDQLDPGLPMAAIVSFVVIAAPLMEEVIFRGFIQPAFVRSIGRWRGILATSVLFALIHISDPQAVFPILLLGVILGWLREKTGGLAAPIALHLANNLSAMILILVLGV